MVTQGKQTRQGLNAENNGPQKLFTVAEYLEFAARPENANRRLELHDGVIVEKHGEPLTLEDGQIIMVSRKENSYLAFLLAFYLGGYILPRRLGYLTTADGGYEVGKDRILMPDVGFITKARAKNIRDGVTFDTAPDLAVEVISPNESDRAIRRKTNAYLKAGTKTVWNVYPNDEEIDVCTLNEAGSMVTQTLTAEDTLDGGDALPGFALSLNDLFGQMTLDDEPIEKQS